MREKVWLYLMAIRLSLMCLFRTILQSGIEKLLSASRWSCQAHMEYFWWYLILPAEIPNHLVVAWCWCWSVRHVLLLYSISYCIFYYLDFLDYYELSCCFLLDYLLWFLHELLCCIVKCCVWERDICFFSFYNIRWPIPRGRSVVPRWPVSSRL
jgi:hypothetical protein